MNSKYSSILVYATLVLLGIFLTFWLRQEYLSEKKRIESDLYLDLIGDIVGLDETEIAQIVMDARDGKGSSNVQMAISMDYQNDTNSNVSFKYTSLDSSSILKFIPDNFKGLKFPKKKIMFRDSNMHHLDSSDFVKLTIDSDFSQKQADTASNALKGILPQIAFALFLFSLLTFGIYLLQKNYKDQQILLENKNNLISNITHELKTPVATIAVALEAIQDFNIKEDKEKTTTYIQTSRSELNRLSSSIDKVLQLSKIDQQQEIYNFESKALLPLVQEVIENLNLQIQHQQVKISIAPLTQNINAKIDSYHFKNVLFNILDNSLKYGKEKGKIHIELKQIEDKAILSIQDDGIGMDAKYHSKIFERFFRISDGNTHNVKGYGLGLSYVKEMIDAHNGTIKVKSKLNQGTNFIISLPIAYD